MRARLLRAIACAAVVLLLGCQEEKPAPVQPQAPPKKTAPLRHPGCESLEGEARALCLAKRCFDKGARAYATSLDAAGGQRYAAGKWLSQTLEGGSFKVTLPIRNAFDRPHDANWEISEGAVLKMRALDADAATISSAHNACR